MKSFYAILLMVCFVTVAKSQTVCDYITKEKDPFTNETIIRTPPYISSDKYPVTIQKYIKNGKISYTMSITGPVSSSTPSTGMRGVTVLFEDGTKLIKQLKVDATVNRGQWEFSSFFTPTAQEITLFSTKKIKAVRLHVYDYFFDTAQSDETRTLIACAKQAK